MRRAARAATAGAGSAHASQQGAAGRPVDRFLDKCMRLRGPAHAGRAGPLVRADVDRAVARGSARTGSRPRLKPRALRRTAIRFFFQGSFVMPNGAFQTVDSWRQLFVNSFNQAFGQIITWVPSVLAM